MTESKHSADSEMMKKLEDLEIDESVDKLKKVVCYSRVCQEDYIHIWKISNFNGIPFVKAYPINSPGFNLGHSIYQIVITKHLGSKNEKGKFAVGDEGESDYENSSTCSDESDSENEDQTERSSLNQNDHPSPEGSRKDLEKIGRLGLRLVKMDDNSTWDAVTYYFLLKSDDIELKTKEREEPGNSDFQSHPLMYEYLTEDDSKVWELFQKKVVEIECHIKYTYVEGNCQEKPRMFEGKKFADDLRILHKSKKFSDIVLRATGGEEFFAHKNVLSARAKGFEKLLNEVEPKKVDIASKEFTLKTDISELETFDLNLDSEVGEMMVNFIYGNDIVNFPAEKCIDLYKAANTYGVINMTRAVSDYFKKHLDENRICKLCLGISDYTDDYIEVIKNLNSQLLKKFLSNEMCSHMI